MKQRKNMCGVSTKKYWKLVKILGRKEVEKHYYIDYDKDKK